MGVYPVTRLTDRGRGIENPLPSSEITEPILSIQTVFDSVAKFDERKPNFVHLSVTNDITGHVQDLRLPWM